jgi:hypothetical protein
MKKHKPVYAKVLSIDYDDYDKKVVEFYCLKRVKPQNLEVDMFPNADNIFKQMNLKVNEFVKITKSSSADKVTFEIERVHEDLSKKFIKVNSFKDFDFENCAFFKETK